MIHALLCKHESPALRLAGLGEEWLEAEAERWHGLPGTYGRSVMEPVLCFPGSCSTTGTIVIELLAC